MLHLPLNRAWRLLPRFSLPDAGIRLCTNHLQSFFPSRSRRPAPLPKDRRMGLIRSRPSPYPRIGARSIPSVHRVLFHVTPLSTHATPTVRIGVEDPSSRKTWTSARERIDDGSQRVVLNMGWIFLTFLFLRITGRPVGRTAPRMRASHPEALARLGGTAFHPLVRGRGWRGPEPRLTRRGAGRWTPSVQRTTGISRRAERVRSEAKRNRCSRSAQCHGSAKIGRSNQPIFPLFLILGCMKDTVDDYLFIGILIKNDIRKSPH